MAKRILSLALAALMLFSFASCEKDDPIETLAPENSSHAHTEDSGEAIEPQMADDFTVYTASGDPVKLSDMFGKPIVLNFWATWCGYCKLEMPDFERARQENPDVLFLMVNVTDGVYETVDSAKKYIEDNGYGFEVVFDTMEQAQNAYGVSAYPTTYFIDEVGNLVAYARGAISYSTLMEGIGRIK